MIEQHDAERDLRECEALGLIADMYTVLWARHGGPIPTEKPSKNMLRLLARADAYIADADGEEGVWAMFRRLRHVADTVQLHFGLAPADGSVLHAAIREMRMVLEDPVRTVKQPNRVEEALAEQCAGKEKDDEG